MSYSRRERGSRERKAPFLCLFVLEGSPADRIRGVWPGNLHFQQIPSNSHLAARSETTSAFSDEPENLVHHPWPPSFSILY